MLLFSFLLYLEFLIVFLKILFTKSSNFYIMIVYVGPTHRDDKLKVPIAKLQLEQTFEL